TDDRNFIRQTDAGSDEGLVKFMGFRNCYHNLNNKFWVVRDSAPLDRQTFLEKLSLESSPSPDLFSSNLEAVKNPWEKERPLLALQESEPKLAYRINQKLAELRQVDATGKRLLSDAIGVEDSAWGKVYDRPLSPPPSVAPIEVARKKKVVDPSG